MNGKNNNSGTSNDFYYHKNIIHRLYKSIVLSARIIPAPTIIPPAGGVSLGL